jgi:hypothetical protein
MGDLRPTYAEGSEEEEEIEEEDGTESDDDEVEDDTYEHPPPPSHPAAMGRGLQKRNLTTNPIPRKDTKRHTLIKANRLSVHLPSTSKA